MYKVLYLIWLLFLFTSCDNEKDIEKIQQTKITVETKYSKNDLAGDWIVFHAKFVKGNKSDRNSLISKKNFVEKDSLILSLKNDGKLLINHIPSGIWSLENDSLLLTGNKEFRDFPLFLDTKYEVHKGNFSKNWYLYCTFYSSNRRIHHTVKYSLRKRG